MDTLEKLKERTDIDVTEFLQAISEYSVIAKIEQNDTSIYSDIFHVLEIVYKDNKYRHSYFEISCFLENELLLDQRDELNETMLKILDESERRLKQNQIKQELQKKILKLSDHISLETLRLSRMDKIKYIGDQTSEKIAKNNELIGEYKKKVKNFEKKINNANAHAITILGIFSGLVIGFATGSDLLIAAISDINSPIYKIALIILIVGFVLFNVVFLLMYCISKVSGFSVSTQCANESCFDCSKCKFAIARLKRKYPLVFWYNIITIFSIICIFVLKYMVKI